MKLKLGIILVCMAAPTLAQGGESAWVEIAPDAWVRLISSDVAENGKTFAALEIDMPSNMKTYWRIPGETGIPTMLDSSASTGIAAADIRWPLPLRENKDGFVDYVYYGYTVLPVELTLTEPTGELNASLVMGVCTDICVPVQADLSLPLEFAKADIGQGLRIRQALSSAPEPYLASDNPIGRAWFDTETQTLNVTVADPALDISTLIVDTGDPADLFGMPQKSPTAGVVSFKLLGRGREGGLHGAPVHFTFVLSDFVYETEGQIDPADAG